MTLGQSSTQPLRAFKAQGLRGRLRVPGDEPVSHRVLMLGALAEGETVIDGLNESPDVLATARAMHALGAQFQRQENRWHIHGLGVGGFLEPQAPLDFGNSITGCFLTMGLVGAYDFPTRFIGGPALSERPLGPCFAPLSRLGTQLIEHRDERLPATLRGPRMPLPLRYRLPVSSGQAKDCALLAALAVPGISTVTEPQAGCDLTERLLADFGAEMEVTANGDGSNTIEIAGLPRLKGRHVLVPGDPSLAGFAIAAALLVPGSDIVVDNLLVNPSRMALVETLLQMGGQIELLHPRRSGGQDVADLRVRHSRLKGITVPAERASALIEDYPVLCVAAAFAQGETLMLGLESLRSMEIDLIAAIAQALEANGVACRQGRDSLAVTGNGRRLGGGMVATQADRRLALAFLVMGLAGERAVTIDDMSVLDAGCPGLLRDFEALGARFERISPA